MTDLKKGKALNRSKQGRIILEELQKFESHPRSDELYLLVRERLPHISLGTVYRNLGRLQQDGLALEIYCGDFVRYDGNVSPHDHFLCRVCRRVWDFDRGHSAPATEVRSNEDGFRVDGYYTVFQELCPDCLEHQKA